MREREMVLDVDWLDGRYTIVGQRRNGFFGGVHTVWRARQDSNLRPRA